jgi:hypothetical protein
MPEVALDLKDLEEHSFMISFEIETRGSAWQSLKWQFII